MLYFFIGCIIVNLLLETFLMEYDSIITAWLFFILGIGVAPIITLFHLIFLLSWLFSKRVYKE